MAHVYPLGAARADMVHVEVHAEVITKSHNVHNVIRGRDVGKSLLEAEVEE